MADLISVTVHFEYNIQKHVNNSVNYEWNVLEFVDTSLQTIWNVWKLVDKEIRFKWNVAELFYLVSNTLELWWFSLLRILKIESELSKDLTIRFSCKKPLEITIAEK